MCRSLGQNFLLVNGTDVLSGEASGAPLRAFGTLAVIWILARFISWNVPENIAPGPLDSLRGHAAIRDIRKMHGTGTAGPAGIRSSEPMVSRNIVAKQLDAKNIPYPARRSIEQDPVRLPFTRRRHSLLKLQPQIIAYRLPSMTSLPPNGSLADRTRSRAMREQSMPAKENRRGLTGYFWIFARQAPQINGPEAIGTRAAISNGQYGGSQTGAILSYPIFTSPGPEVAVYGRLSAALAPLAQKELALGGRLRLFESLPLSIHAEQRFSAESGRGGGTAFFATSGAGPNPIIEKIMIETYAQAGYVLGDEQTYFFDGFATLQRPIIKSDRKKLSIGTGAWVGGQRNVARLDIGPRADIRIPLGAADARIAVDWRVRVAGDAQPRSGAAITLSTSF